MSKSAVQVNVEENRKMRAPAPRSATATGATIGHETSPNEEVKEIWGRFWVCLNELMAHALLLVGFVLVMFVLQRLNHLVNPPEGLMLFEDERLGRIPLDWGFTASDVGVIARFAWLSVRIFRKG